MSEESASGRYLLLMVPVECTEQSSRQRAAGVASIIVPDRSGALRVGPFEVTGERDTVGWAVLSGPGGPGKRQRLTWNTSFGPPLWTCSGCGSGLVSGILAHRDSCTEVR